MSDHAEQSEAMATKSHANVQTETIAWLQEVTGESMEGMTVHEWLHDGVILIKLLNILRPNVNLKPKKMKAAMFLRDNISMFLKHVRKEYPQMKESDMFGTNDLYENQNMRQVMYCIYCLGGVLQTCDDFKGPKLGVPHNALTKNVGRRDCQNFDNFDWKDKGFAPSVDDAYRSSANVFGRKTCGVGTLEQQKTAEEKEKERKRIEELNKQKRDLFEGKNVPKAGWMPPSIKNQHLEDRDFRTLDRRVVHRG